jgi:16S rRNA C967 or C1407 C5-methylase (RsmB/RsmF family)
LHQSPELKEFLLQGSQNGTVARQDLGSCLPVLLLVQSALLHKKSRVLDLCASPGNKTLQAAELCAKVRANDIHEARVEALKQAVARSGLDANIHYCCHDGTQYPLRKNYDYVICDVPCSGDGTIRKESHILTHWNPKTANALHATQVKLLQRALQLGSMVTYSTCSLNPVENEAVVAAVLASDGDYELVELPSLPGLQHRPGVQHWNVGDYAGDVNEEEQPLLRWHATYQDAIQAGMKDAVPTLWPSSSVQPIHLERCFRLWPQDHDSGGFFVALLRKKSSQ